MEFSDGTKSLCYNDDESQIMYYTGPLVNEKRNGIGMMRYFLRHSDSSEEYLGYYEGGWENDKKCGKGVVYNHKGQKTFDGLFHEDVFICGNIIDFDGLGHISYQGGYANDSYNGEGILFHSNSIKKYEGTFLNGKKNGNGILYNNIGMEIKNGVWENDKFIDGIFTDYHISGQISYQGTKNTKLQYHGHGTQYTLNGLIVYEGEYKNGKKNGHGTFYNNGILHYIGNFKNDMVHGSGILFFQTSSPYYEGKFVKNEIFGNGKLFWPSGSLHKEGYFKNAKLSGKGTVYDKDGKTVLQKGKFVQDQIIDEDSFSIRKFLETKDESVVKKVSKSFLKSFLQEKYNVSLPLNQKKEKFLSMIYELYIKEKQQEVHYEEDLFGNTIQIPCQGNDGGVYDISSMNYLFEKDSNGEYKNIPYGYNEQHKRTPNFPVMTNGNRLSSFTILLNEN
jgi:hypothetical protein